MAGSIKKHPKGVLCKYSNSLELTFTKQAGMSLEAISEALTHSDKEITKTYVNIKDKVNQTVGDIAFRSLKN